MSKSATAKNKNVDPEIKNKALNDYLNAGHASAVARKYGVSESSIYNWKSRMSSYKPSGSDVLDKQKFKKLEAALAEKNLENEILRDLIKKLTRSC